MGNRSSSSSSFFSTKTRSQSPSLRRVAANARRRRPSSTTISHQSLFRAKSKRSMSLDGGGGVIVLPRPSQPSTIKQRSIIIDDQQKSSSVTLARKTSISSGVVGAQRRKSVCVIGNTITPIQQQLLQRFWKRINSNRSTNDSIGCKIFANILRNDDTSSIAQIFGLDSTMSIAELRYDQRFKTMSANITRTLQMVMTNLTNLDTFVVDNLRQLGRRHVNYDHRTGLTTIFRSDYWNQFADAFVECDCNSGFRCRETMNAWRLIVQFIIQHVRDGYEMEKMYNRSLINNNRIM